MTKTFGQWEEAAEQGATGEGTFLIVTHSRREIVQERIELKPDMEQPISELIKATHEKLRTERA